MTHHERKKISILNRNKRKISTHKTWIPDREIAKKVGRFVRDLRESRNFSQDAMGVAQTTVSKIENGIIAIYFERLVQIMQKTKPKRKEMLQLIKDLKCLDEEKSKKKEMLQLIKDLKCLDEEKDKKERIIQILIELGCFNEEETE